MRDLHLRYPVPDTPKPVRVLVSRLPLWSVLSTSYLRLVYILLNSGSSSRDVHYSTTVSKIRIGDSRGTPQTFSSVTLSFQGVGCLSSGVRLNLKVWRITPLKGVCGGTLRWFGFGGGEGRGGPVVRGSIRSPGGERGSDI